MPDEPINPASIPSTAAQVASILQKEHNEQVAKQADSLNIVDPGQPPRPQAAPAPTTEGQGTIPGATPDAGLTPELLARAKTAGISEDEAKAYKTEHLTRFIEREEAIKAREELYEEPETFVPSPAYPPGPPQADPGIIRGPDGRFYRAPWAGQVQQPQQPELGLPDLPPLQDGEWQPELVQWSQAARNAYTQQQLQLLQVQQQLQAIHNQTVSAQQERQNRELDEAFAADKDYHDQIGEGFTEDVQGTRYLPVRQQIANTMDLIIQSARQRGVRPPAFKGLYERARLIVCGVKAAKTPNVAAHLGQFINRPTATHRNDDLPKGPERAERAAANLIAEQNAARNGR